jgi:DNA repair/transcription protein MET18/MMS19
MRFVDRLFEVLDDEQIGWDAARGIGEIGSTDKILTKRNHAIIRVYNSVRSPLAIRV